MRPSSRRKGKKRKHEDSKPKRSADSNIDDRKLEICSSKRSIFSSIGRGKPELSSVLNQNCNLPEEVWIKIFEFAILGYGSIGFRTLLTICQTCRSWRNIIVSSPRFWRVIDLSEIRPTSRSDILSLCDKDLFKYTTHLSLAGWTILDRNSFAHLLKKCGNLLGLDISGCGKFDGHCLSLLVEFAPKLREIDLSKTYTGDAIKNRRTNANFISSFPLFPQATVDFITRRGKDLKSINLSENRINQINTIYKAIVQNCPSLQVLDLSNILTHSTFCINSDSLLESCPQLRVLRLGNVAIKPYKKIESGLPNLEELCLPNNDCESAINDQILNGFAGHSRRLKLLDIRGSSRVTSDCLLKLPATDLQYLSIDNCTHIFSYGLEIVMNKWKHSLKNIDASQNFYPYGIEEGINLLVQSGSSPLETFNLRGSSLSFDAVIKLVLSCPKLRMVDLQSCRALPRGTKRLFRDAKEIKELRKFIYDEKHLH